MPSSVGRLAGLLRMSGGEKCRLAGLSPTVRNFRLPLTSATKARFTGPPAFPGRANASPANGFSRNTRHETRITAFMLLSLLSLCVVARHGAATEARHGLAAVCPGMLGNSGTVAVFTRHETRFFPAGPESGDFPRRALPASLGFQRVFHETRDHETRITAFMLLSLLSFAL